MWPKWSDEEGQIEVTDDHPKYGPQVKGKEICLKALGEK